MLAPPGSDIAETARLLPTQCRLLRLPAVQEQLVRHACNSRRCPESSTRWRGACIDLGGQRGSKAIPTASGSCIDTQYQRHNDTYRYTTRNTTLTPPGSECVVRMLNSRRR